jgi:hypothetical protein
MNKHELKSLLENISSTLTQEGYIPPPPLGTGSEQWPTQWPDVAPKPPVTPTITPYDPVVLDPTSIPTLLRELNFPITIPPDLTNEGLEEWLKGLNWWQITQIWGWYTLHIAPNLTPEQLEFVEKWKQAHGM